MKIKKKTFTFSTIVIFIIGIIQSISYSYAQESGASFIASSNFQMTEFSEDYGIQENSTSINIDVKSPNRILTEIDLNFSNIRMNSEIKIIEEEATGFEVLRGNTNEILGMQINITEPTIIYSVEIFGYKAIKTTSPSPVYFRIEGWDSNNSRPNGVSYSIPVILNMTEDIPNWNKQIFQFPVYLSSGLYCFLLDGTEISWNDKYYWYINNDNPTSQLSMCLYNEELDEWQNRTGDVFLHKIKQKLNRSYIPSEINMIAKIGDNSYVIEDGKELGIGSLSIENLDFEIMGTMIDIIIINNLTISLEFEICYYISLKYLFLSVGSVNMQEDSINQWTINPEFTRVLSSYSIKFFYPRSWFNFIVYRNGIDIISDVSINETNNFLFISNDTIKDGAIWVISAYSPKISFSLNVPKTDFGPLQNLKFSVIAPIIQGKITYILFDSLGFEEFRETKEVLSQETLFCCNISQNPVPGIYKAYLFWYNNSDAGIESQEFSINIPFTIPLELIYGILLLLSIILGGTVFGSVLINRKRRINVAQKQKIYNKFIDALNIHYFIISDKNSGLTVYEKLFKGKNIDSSLISGFLQAVHAFGIELTEAEEHTRSLKLDYQNSKILLSDYKNIRIILIMEKDPSQDFFESLNALSHHIEEKFGHLLERFDGDITQFKEIRDLLNFHLSTFLNYPLRLGNQPKRITSEEMAIINQAKKKMKEKNSDHFFILSLYDKTKEIKVTDAETVLNLIQKKAFQPIGDKKEFNQKKLASATGD